MLFVVIGVLGGSLGVGVDGAEGVGVGVVPSSSIFLRFFCRLAIWSLIPSSMELMSDA